VSRSFLYVSADRRDHLAKAVTRTADALIVDLEDAVAPARKQIARESLVDWLRTAQLTRPVWVRVNSGPLRLEDLTDLAPLPQIAGFCLAKASCVADVEEAAEVLAQRGSQALLAPILEDPGAVFDARAIAGASRVARLQLGEADLRAATAITTGPDEVEMLWARSQVVFASAAAGIGSPLGPVSTNFTDLAALANTT
jgi:citrate lyase subunit beta/citryl-CoA lyase